jgi:hypothetical protein
MMIHLFNASSTSTAMMGSFWFVLHADATAVVWSRKDGFRCFFFESNVAFVYHAENSVKEG